MVAAILGIQGSLSTTRMRAFGVVEGLKRPLDDLSTTPGQALVSVFVDFPVPAPVATFAFLRLGAGRLLLFGAFAPGRVARSPGRRPTLEAGVERRPSSSAAKASWPRGPRAEAAARW